MPLGPHRDPMIPREPGNAVGTLCQRARRKQQEKLEEQLGALRGLKGVRGSWRHFDCPPKMPHGSCLCLLAGLAWFPARKDNRREKSWDAEWLESAPSHSRSVSSPLCSSLFLRLFLGKERSQSKTVACFTLVLIYFTSYY